MSSHQAGEKKWEESLGVETNIVFVREEERKKGGGIAVALQIHSSFISGAKTAEPPQVLHNSTDNNRRCEQGVGGRVQVFIS